MADGRMTSVADMAQQAADLAKDASDQVVTRDPPELREALGRLMAAASEAAQIASQHAGARQ